MSGVAARARRSRAAARPPRRRPVIRDERSEETLCASDESAEGNIPADFEAEIYRRESRDGQCAGIGYAVALDSANPKIALVDWCAFTLRPPEGETYLWVIHELRRLIGFEVFTQRRAGLYGYRFSAIIEGGGLMAWGGKNQGGTTYASLNGQGCARVGDWAALREWCECHRARITRLDLAHDDFEGKTVTIEKAREWYDANGFNAGGRKPSPRVAGDWWGGVKGRTVYFGARENGKLARIYEKGKQEGDPQSRWTRIEVELHNKSRVIPLDAMTKPAAYLAGAYPCLCYLSTEQCKIKTIRKGAKTAYKRAVEVARNQYGKLIHVMLQVHGGDACAVVQDLVRIGVPGRLDPYSYHLRTDPALVYSLDAGDESHAAVVA